MRTIPILAGAALVLVAAGATMAASPTPSQAPAASPAPKTPAQAAPAASGTTTQTWSAPINPLDVTTGTATVVSAADGTGTLTIKLHGLDPQARWTVDVDGGTLAQPRETAANEIASRSGVGGDKVSNDTLRIQLSKREMKDFSAARASHGVVVLVSDGANQAAASFMPG